jgi:hypothetical protein
MKRRHGAFSVVALVTLLTVTAGGSIDAASASCPNEARRVEQGATALPDCRAFELVTPGAMFDGSRIGRAAVGGSAVTYFTKHPAPEAASSAFFYLATRGGDGWSGREIGPQNVPGALFGSLCEQNVFFSPDLSENVLEAGRYIPEEPARCKRPEEIVPGEPVPYRNVFLQDQGKGTIQLLNAPPPGMAPENASFQDASDDFSHIFFGEGAPLTPDAGPGYDFYLWRQGVVRLLTYLPDGTPASGELVEATSRSGGGPLAAGSGFAPVTGAVSADGRRAFFYSGEGLYLRDNADQPQSATLADACLEPARACTLQVDASQGPGASGGGVFWRATSDGSQAFFTDTHKLRVDSGAEDGKADLYRFDAEGGELVDLTPWSGEAADVRGVAGMAEDGSFLYFVANGALAPGATPGDCHGNPKTPGHCNLYVLHTGSISFIARLSGDESWVWQEAPERSNSRLKQSLFWAAVSPNGKHLAFLSRESLTGYDNYDAQRKGPDRELYLYDAEGTGRLTCLTCLPGESRNPFQNIAGPGNYGPLGSENPSWAVNSVLDDGTAFFTTANQLVPQDADSEEDLYEYDGSELHLISLGETSGRVRFLDASPDGADLFFSTAEPLVGQDLDGANASLYDARVDGGYPQPPSPPPGCEGDACRLAVPPPPIDPVPVTGGGSPNRPEAKKKKRCRRHRAHHRRRCRGGRHGGRMHKQHRQKKVKA